eukprot:gene43976-9811_t
MRQVRMEKEARNGTISVTMREGHSGIIRGFADNGDRSPPPYRAADGPAPGGAFPYSAPVKSRHPPDFVPGQPYTRMPKPALGPLKHDEHGAEMRMGEVLASGWHGLTIVSKEQVEMLLLMEFCPGQTMYNFVQGWVHRDVRCANVFLCSPPPHSLYKLGDFGLARDEGEGPENFPWPWTSPDALESGVFDSGSDCWSLGVLMWEIATGCRRRPYVADFADGRQALMDWKLLPRPDDVADDKAITPLWQKPAERASAAACRKSCLAIHGKPVGQSPRCVSEGIGDRQMSSGSQSPGRRRSLMGGETTLKIAAGAPLGRVIPTLDAHTPHHHMVCVVELAAQSSIQDNIGAHALPPAARHPHIVHYLGHTAGAERSAVYARACGGPLDDYARQHSAACGGPLDDYARQHSA